MELYDKNEIRSFLEKQNFVFKKSLGQNFLIDGSVAPRMAAVAADGDTGVIEIGPGAGVLTKELCARAKRVVAVEIDKSLEPVLKKTLANTENVRLIFGDVLKADLAAVIKESFAGCSRVTVCANLPYYITSPIITGLLKQKLPIESITVMVQKEAAERICAPVGSRSAGAVTALIAYYAKAERLFPVPKGSFLPPPKVDSEVIKLSLLASPPVKVMDEEFFFKTVNACFALRRKTAINSISNALGVGKETLKEIFARIGIDETARGENFDMETLAALSAEIKKHLQNG
ncbi:MAG: 16S rRNA (adenine(1518)-N(6)/adenine(1519)-N(6))-dimethyltransferase RsmA [Clostridia bacterium]|nr:16S rRNA (adenine(1518)-N(6)/adenine(1519)-N(6))-dimethyltransferase RsmA [Clostridia bacterium]